MCQKRSEKCLPGIGYVSKLYIDFTVGTKAMSAAAVMAGVVINIQLVYVETNGVLLIY